MLTHPVFVTQEMTLGDGHNSNCKTCEFQEDRMHSVLV